MSNPTYAHRHTSHPDGDGGTIHFVTDDVKVHWMTGRSTWGYVVRPGHQPEYVDLLSDDRTRTAIEMLEQFGAERDMMPDEVEEWTRVTNSSE